MSSVVAGGTLTAQRPPPQAAALLLCCSAALRCLSENMPQIPQLPPPYLRLMVGSGTLQHHSTPPLHAPQGASSPIPNAARRICIFAFAQTRAAGQAAAGGETRRRTQGTAPSKSGMTV